MNIKSGSWIKYKNKNINLKLKDHKLYVENLTSTYGYYVKPRLFNCKSCFMQISFEGESIRGNSAVLCLFDSKRNLIGEVTLNGKAIFNVESNKKYLCGIKILPQSEVMISKIEITYKEQEADVFKDFGDTDTLVITPSYPSLENKYFGGFVHSRLKAYKESGIKFDVACCYFYENLTQYEFEGIRVLKLHFSKLRTLLQEKKYKRILVHFFDRNYAQIFDGIDLTETKLFLWVHGPETLYRDWPKFMTKYFESEYKITEYDESIFKNNDKLIKRYNNNPNVTWIFVSDWIKRQSEQLIGIKFKNYVVIPNIVDENTFQYVPKTADQRKKIFFLRRFDNIDKYAIDVNVRTILELSRRRIFEDLEFNIYGIGDFYDELVDPIRKFSNVHLYPRFLNHDEIAKIHRENGIALFATRYDAQGVSMCEAAMSGMVVVSSQNDAIKEFIPSDVNLLAPTEDPEKYADIIERLYNNEEEFMNLSKLCHDKVNSLCSSKETIQKEIDLFKIKSTDIEINKISQSDDIVLSIIIPAYNVAKYLKNGISTIVNHRNADKLEILIINDGSKDDTVKIAKEIINKWCNKKKPIITLIDKENGGHGSTINVGISKAKGKYTRIIDGDDWVNTEEFSKLLDILQKEDSDIVVTNYSEDIANQNILIERRLYDFMKVGKKYNFDDLCNKYYGFKEWGPILATGNFKTSMLKSQNFKLTEKCFYVDMEFDIYSVLSAKTVTYYDFDVYRYFIGRVDQSISQTSFIKNRKQHEKVLFNMLSILDKNEMSDEKRDYITRLLITPMIKAHYIILADYMKDRKEFINFDKSLKKETNLYFDSAICTNFIKFHRKTKGYLLFANNILKKINKMLKRGR